MTIPGDTLLFTSSATEAAITTLETAKTNPDNLVWRTCPSDNIQAQALVLHFPSVVAAAEHRYPNIDTTHLKVVVAHHSAAYGSGLAEALEGQIPGFTGLSFNGKLATDPTNNGCTADSSTSVGSPTDPTACFLDVNYQDASNADYLATIAAFDPDIVFVFGDNEGPDVIFRGVEKAWAAPADDHYPFWIFSDGGEDSSLWASSTMPTMAADITTEDQRERVTGSVPGTNSTAWPPYNQFLLHFGGSPYSSDESPDQLGPAGAYDIMYLLAFSTVMVGQNPLTGPNLVSLGLKKMQHGGSMVPFQIGPQSLPAAFTTLSGDGPVNVAGVSGALPFTGTGDITTADIQIWCVPPNPAPGADAGTADVGIAAINSGYYFDSTKTAMAGCLSTMCALPDFTAVNCP
jgi:hypothetical protein